MKNININFECFNKSFLKNQNILYNILDIRKEFLKTKYFFLEDFLCFKNFYNNNNNIIGSDEQKINFLQNKISFERSIIIINKIFNSYNFCEKYFFQYKKSFYELLKKKIILENCDLQKQNKVHDKSIANFSGSWMYKIYLSDKEYENVKNSLQELTNNISNLEKLIIIIFNICFDFFKKKQDISKMINYIINDNYFFNNIFNFINIIKDNNNDELKNLQEKYIYLNKKNTILMNLLNNINNYVHCMNENKNNEVCIKDYYNNFLENLEKIKQVI